MVYIIKKSASLEEIERLFSLSKSKGRIKGGKKFDAYKFLGKFKKRGDAVLIQRKMRDEWK